MKRTKTYYFTTRDLMMMAALAAMGGISSTYINMIGDFFQGLLGFAGTTQWAAGLHIIWIMLAAALINKPGAATTTGIIKGFVELLSGNTHGLLVLIIDITAGLIIDLILLSQKDKKPGLLFLLAAGLGSASNIFIFQFFASIPKDILTFLAILISSSVSFISGVVFGGFLVKGLLASLEKVGFYTAPKKENQPPKKVWPLIIVFTALLLAAGSGWLYFQQQAGTQRLSIIGNLSNPYEFPNKENNIASVEVVAELNGVSKTYTGYRLSDIVDFAQPIDKEGVLQMTASDGYSFFIPLEEVYSNANLIISQQKSSNNSVFNVVGAKSSKAWIRGISEIKLVKMEGIEIKGSVLNPFIFKPEEWVSEMDSTLFTIKGEPKKLQGVPLAKVWERSQPESNASEIIVFFGNNPSKMDKNQIFENDSIRLFLNLMPDGAHYLIGTMTGEIMVNDLTSIEIK